MPEHVNRHRILLPALVGLLAIMTAAATSAQAASWSAPESVDEGYFTEPQVAVDAAGDATAVWWGDENNFFGAPVLFGTHRSAGGQWSTPVKIAGDEAVIEKSQLFPRIAMASNGAATVVWSERIRSNAGEFEKVMTAECSAGGTWSAPVELADEGYGAQVSVTPDGAALAVWTTDRGPEALMSASRSAGGQWSTPSTVAQVKSGESVEGLRIAADDASAVVAWSQFSDGEGGPENHLMAVSRSATGPWSSPVDLGVERTGGTSAIAMDGAGDATVVWASGVAKSASHPAGGSWSVPVSISSEKPELTVDETGNGAPTVAVSPQGDVSAAWWSTQWSDEYTKSERVLGVASRSAGKAWSTPEETAVPEAEVENFYPSVDVVLDPEGDAVASWAVHPSEGGVSLWSTSRPAGGSWSTATRVFADPQAGYAIGLQTGTPVAIDASGTATALWVDAVPNQKDILYSATSSNTPAVAITGGPSGVVKANHAIFTFDSGVSGTEYQCELDEGGWKTCTSPQEYTGLADGEHSFSVRSYDAADELGGEPTKVTWTVDTTAPRTTITAGPSGRVEEADVSFSFKASEEGASFACSLDGAAFTPCTSPRAYEPGDGPHTFKVRATDRAGNEEAVPASRSFEVAGGAVCPVSFKGGAHTSSAGARSSGLCGSESMPAPAECPAHAWPERGFGAFVVVAETRAACFHLRKGVYVSSGPVRLNGMLLTLPKGAQISLDYNRNTLETSATGEIKLASWMPSIPIGPLDWQSFRPTFRLGLPFEHQVPISLFAQRVKMPKVELDSDNAGFGAGNGGATRIDMTIEVPSLFGHPTFSQLHGTAEVSNGNGFQWVGEFKDPEKIEIGGGLEFENLTAKLDSLEQSATLGGTVVFPAGAEVTAEIGLTRSGVSTFKLAADDLNKPIGWGFFLQRLHIARGLNVNLTPEGRVTNETLSGGGGGSFGPQLAETGWQGRLAQIFQTRSLISLDGEATLGAATANNPWYMITSGDGKLLNMQIAKAAVELQETGAVTIWGNFSLGLWGWGANFEVPRGEGWYDHPSGTMQLRGLGHLQLPGLAQGGDAEVLVNNYGLTACQTVDSHGRSIPVGERSGFDFAWGGSFGRIKGCDLSKLISPAPGSARVSTAGGPEKIVVPPNTRLFEFEATGEGAAPKIEVSGPHGERVSTPEDESGVQQGGITLVQSAQDDVTDVIVRRPLAGSWTVTPESGSAPLVGVQVAHGLPAPRVKARLTGCPRRCLLHYSAKRIPGQRIVLYEVGAGASRSLGTLKEGAGRLRFRPLVGGSGTRRLVAQVLQYGEPREQLTLARFHVSEPRPPAPRRLRLHRRGTLLTASWARVKGARGYTVTVRLSHRPPLSLNTRATRLALTVGHHSKVAVAVRAVGELRDGRASIARLHG